MNGKELKDLLNKMSDKDLKKPINWYNTEWASEVEITEVRIDEDKLTVN